MQSPQRFTFASNRLWEFIKNTQITSPLAYQVRPSYRSHVKIDFVQKKKKKKDFVQIEMNIYTFIPLKVRITYICFVIKDSYNVQHYVRTYVIILSCIPSDACYQAHVVKSRCSIHKLPTFYISLGFCRWLRYVLDQFQLQILDSKMWQLKFSLFLSV